LMQGGFLEKEGKKKKRRTNRPRSWGPSRGRKESPPKRDCFPLLREEKNHLCNNRSIAGELSKGKDSMLPPMSYS